MALTQAIVDIPRNIQETPKQRATQCAEFDVLQFLDFPGEKQLED